MNKFKKGDRVVLIKSQTANSQTYLVECVIPNRTGQPNKLVLLCEVDGAIVRRTVSGDLVAKTPPRWKSFATEIAMRTIMQVIIAIIMNRPH